MVRFNNTIYFDPGNGEIVFLSDMQNKTIFHIPERYAEMCNMLQHGCSRESISKELLDYFENKHLIIEK